ncbi:MAG: WYL domain-containing protein, partial [Chitinophagaceae bacterium]|nr:WYL domain-containing protein [Chitinophagaceae bacterium]
VVDKKYYTYEDPEYSITNIALSKHDLESMNEAVEVLKQFKGFNHFSSLNDVVQKLEHHIYTSTNNTAPVIDFEKNERLKGLEHLDVIYNAIINRKVLNIEYKSFKAREANVFHYHAWWLKEFKNRWFAVGIKTEGGRILTLALDRMLNVSIAGKEKYIKNDQTTAESYYNNVIGVTVNEKDRLRNVTLFVTDMHAPYVETKPLHHSQVVVHREKEGIIVQIKVQLNFELEKEILGFGDGMIVLGPKKLRERIQGRMKGAIKMYGQKKIS